MVVLFLGTRGVGDGSRVARGLNGNPRERNDMMKNGGQESKRTCRGERACVSAVVSACRYASMIKLFARNAW